LIVTTGLHANEEFFLVGNGFCCCTCSL